MDPQVTKILSAISTALNEKASAKSRLKIVGRYAQFCHSKVLSPFPVKLPTLQAFLASFMVANNGSTKSLHQLIGHLRSYSTTLRISWLDTSDSQSLKQWVAEAQYLDSTPTNQKAPLTAEILYRMTPLLSQSLSDTMMKTILWMNHDGLLRLCEALRDHTPQNIIWNKARTAFDLQLFRTKGHRKGAHQLVHFSTRKGPCAVKHMKQLFDMADLWTKPKSIIFQSSRNSNSAFSCAWFRDNLKVLCSKLGLNPDSFSGHSGRAGGATDLFNMNVPYVYIKLWGRWKSDTALIYYRDKVAAKLSVATAFASLASSLL